MNEPNEQSKFLKFLIWSYFLLLIFEGSVRKWGPPGLNYPFLIIRDPVLILIYAVAIARGFFPINLYLIGFFAIGVATTFFAITAGHGNLFVTAYGIHYNFLHFPLIWVMAKALDRRDVLALGAGFIVLSIPNSLLMAVQFNSHPFAWINKGVGEGIGGQIDGGGGKIRPPGFFSFITGNNLFYPFVFAFLFAQFAVQKIVWWWLYIPALVLAVIALPISISRGLVIASAFVIIPFMLIMGKRGIFSAKLVGLALFLPLIGIVLYSFVPVFQEGIEIFLARWERSTGERQGGIEGAIFGRVFAGFTNAYYYALNAEIFGRGIGLGSNVAARFLQGEMGFLLAEDEWSRIVLEMGPLLGFAFILLRIVVCLHMLIASLQELFKKDNGLPLLISAAAIHPMLQGQIAPPTMLGFTVFGAGLVFAACNYDPDSEYEDEEAFEEDDEGAYEDEDDFDEVELNPNQAQDLPRDDV